MIPSGRWARPAESLLGRLAPLLAQIRPLKPYSGWYFGIAEDNAGWPAHVRAAVWRFCREQRLQPRAVLNWHYGLRVNAYLGNDMSRCLYIGGCIEPNE